MIPSEETNDCDGECDYCTLYNACHSQDEDEEPQDSGFLGSMMEAQLVRDGQQVCEECGKKISSVLDKDNPNPCKNDKHQSFKRLFDVRVEVGLNDLKVRGYD